MTDHLLLATDALDQPVQNGDTIVVAFREGNIATLRFARVIGAGERDGRPILKLQYLAKTGFWSQATVSGEGYIYSDNQNLGGKRFVRWEPIP